MTMIRKTILAACAALALIVPQGAPRAEESPEIDQEVADNLRMAIFLAGQALGMQAKCGVVDMDTYLGLRMRVVNHFLNTYLVFREDVFNAVVSVLKDGVEYSMFTPCTESNIKYASETAARRLATLDASLED